MSPYRDPLAPLQRKKKLLAAGLCVRNPKHGSRRPHAATCEYCARKKSVQNARNNPKRKLKES